MRNSTFDTYISTNDRLHNKLSQADEYEKFLKRVENIVDRKRKVDRSPDFYMTFLNKSREKANKQKSLERESEIQLGNRHLLEKIQREKNRKIAEYQTIHEVHMEEKRIRDQEKINEENSKMAHRIMNQDSYLRSKKILRPEFYRSSPEKLIITNSREEDSKFFDSRIKNRKLPKLIKSPSVSNTSFPRESRE